MNEQPISIAEARNLVASPLWPRIRVFLWDFASLCDPVRVKGVLLNRHPELATRLLSLATADGTLREPRCARAAERVLGVTPFLHTFPADDGSRLLLLSREDYNHLAQFLGAVACTSVLRRITAGADVRELKAALPGVYPEAMAFAAYFRRFESLFSQYAPAESGDSSPVSRHSSLPEVVVSAGHSLVALALSHLPAPLIRRQRLRFPAGDPGYLALAGIAVSSASTSSQAKTALDAALLALKLSNPSEYNTLCS